MEVEELRKELEAYAKSKGFKLNPDKKLVEMLIKALLENEKKYGKRYCPCRPFRSDETVCPCKWHEEEIRKQGRCHCGLFVKDA